MSRAKQTMRSGMASGKRAYDRPQAPITPSAAAVKVVEGAFARGSRAKADMDAAHYARPREPHRYAPRKDKGYGR